MMLIFVHDYFGEANSNSPSKKKKRFEIELKWYMFLQLAPLVAHPTPANYTTDTDTHPMSHTVVNLYFWLCRQIL